MGLKVAWNRNKTASVVLAKIKEFTIGQNTYNDKFHVRGWYNKENHFSFGDDFEDLTVAQVFLNEIHSQM